MATLYETKLYNLSLVTTESVRIFDQVSHKPRCSASGDGKKLEISDLGSRGIGKTKAHDLAADLRLCFRICKKAVFSWSGSFESCVGEMIWEYILYGVLEIPPVPCFIISLCRALIMVNKPTALCFLQKAFSKNQNTLM